MKTVKMLKSVTVLSLLTVATVINPNLAFAEGDGRGSNGPDLAGASIPVQLDRDVTEFEVAQALTYCSYQAAKSIADQAFGPAVSMPNRNDLVKEEIGPVIWSDSTLFLGENRDSKLIRTETKPIGAAGVTILNFAIQEVKYKRRYDLMDNPSHAECSVGLSWFSSTLRMRSNGCTKYLNGEISNLPQYYNNPEVNFMAKAMTTPLPSPLRNYGSALPSVSAEVASVDTIVGEFGEIVRTNNRLRNVRIVYDTKPESNVSFKMDSGSTSKVLKLKLNTTAMASCIADGIRNGTKQTFEFVQ